MKRPLLASLLLSAATFADPAPADKPAAEQPLPATPAGRLVVHEWGTFTNFAGSDGIYLDYRPLVFNDLPEFVFDRGGETAIVTKRPQYARPNFIGKYDIRSRSRMETPVTYFYTDAPMQLEARVDFPQGMLTDLYPPAKAMAPLVDQAEIDGSKKPAQQNSFIDWGRFTVIPQASATEDQRKLPEVKTGDHYAAARATDSDLIELPDPAMHLSWREKFLFYRGVGNFDLPVSMKSLGNGRFAVTNTGREAIRAAFLVSISAGKVQFARYHDLASQAALALLDESSTLDALADAMAGELTAAGLYPKESRAMVETWKSSWFGEDGTRLLYLLPQSFTDQNLPLHITPRPQTMTRVMVGRLEALTPEAEAGIATLIQKMGHENPKAREAAMHQLQHYGRFAEPALLRVGLTSEDPEIRARTQVLLHELRVEHK